MINCFDMKRQPFSLPRKVNQAGVLWDSVDTCWIDKARHIAYYHHYIGHRYIWMKAMTKQDIIDPEHLLPLTPAVFHILLALADRERHGYAIMQEVAADTQGQVQMGPGTLYGTIKRMIATGLVEESDERPDPALDDERRRYYRLTDLGHRVAVAEARRLSSLVDVAHTKRLIGGMA